MVDREYRTNSGLACGLCNNRISTKETDRAVINKYMNAITTDAQRLGSRKLRMRTSVVLCDNESQCPLNAPAVKQDKRINYSQLAFDMFILK